MTIKLLSKIFDNKIVAKSHIVEYHSYIDENMTLEKLKKNFQDRWKIPEMN